jgi:hypothetical protein
VSFSLYDSSDATFLTIETVTTVSGLFPRGKNIGLRQPPYSEYAFVIGDGRRKIEPITLGVMLRGTNKADCETELRLLRDFAQQATSLRFLQNSAFVYRSLQPPPNAAYLQNEDQVAPNLLTVDLVLLPRYADFTTTLAESRAAFDAATKRMF